LFYFSYIIRSTVAQAKTVFHKIKKNLCNKSLVLETKTNKKLQTYIKPILFYGDEAQQADGEMYLSTEMWSIHRMRRIPWKAGKKKAEILLETNQQIHYCRLKENKLYKVYSSFSLKREKGRHHDNRKSIWKTRQRKAMTRYWTAWPNGWG
jgi:hypothetical protein